MFPRSFVVCLFILCAVGTWWAGRLLASSLKTLDLPTTGVAVASSSSALPHEELHDISSETVLGEFQIRMASIPPESGSFRQLAQLFRSAEDLAPEHFPEALRRLAETKYQGRLLDASLLAVWAERDMHAARSWFASQSPDAQKRLFAGWADTWARLDFAGLRKWLSTRTDAERRALTYSEDLKRTLGAVDPEASIEMLAGSQNIVAREILSSWARRDPVAAAYASLHLDGNPATNASMFFVVQVWAASSPEAALAWADELVDPAVAERARFAIAIQLLIARGIATADLIRSRFPAAEQDRALTHIAWGVSHTDPESVVKWAQANAEPALRRAMMERAIEVMASRTVGQNSVSWPPFAPGSELPKAARLTELWVAESTAAGEPLKGAEQVFLAVVEQDGLASGLGFLAQVARQFPTAAAGMFDSLAATRGWPFVAEAAFGLPPGPVRAEWLNHTAVALVSSGDIAVAEDLIQRLEESERNPLLRTIAAAAFKERQPEQGANILVRLPNGGGELKKELLKWLGEDRKSATQWIIGTPALTPTEKEQLLPATP